MVIGMVLALLCTGGCSGFGKFSAGAQSVVDVICSPTPEQQATAASMLMALDAAQAAGTIFFPALGIAKASAVLTSIKAGSCFLLSELAEAFKAVDAANVATAQVQLKMLRAAPAVLPEYPALRRLVK
jgi:hypothetical protein